MKRSPSRQWSPEEDELLSRRYPIEGTKLLATELGLEAIIIRRRARRLGLSLLPDPSLTWSEAEDHAIRTRFPAEGRLIPLAGRSKYDIGKRARRLGVVYGRRTKQRAWDAEQLAILHARYATEGSSKDLQLTLGRSRDQIRCRASELGLRCLDETKRKRMSEGQGRGVNNARYEGYKCIQSSYLSNARCNARRRGLDHEAVANTLENKQYLFSLVTDRCPLSGRPLTFRKDSQDSDGTASLDRIDSSKGYIKGNVQWVDKRVNAMKMDLSEDEFVALCCDIARHRGGLK